MNTTSLLFMLLTLFAVVNCTVNISQNCICVRTESCNVKMCVHPVIKGFDELKREVLETQYSYDDNDNCDYIELNSLVSNDTEDLTILNLNIRGMFSKLGKLCYLIDHVSKNEPPDVITLCETWLSKHTPHFKVPGYKLYRNDRKDKKGGGVGILVRQGLMSHEIEGSSLNIAGTETIAIELNSGSGSVGVICMYRPPNTNPTQFCKTFNQVVKRTRKSCKDIIIGLDHNLDFLKSHTHKPMNEFIETVLDLNLVPTTTRPTGITKSTATLIDNIIVDHRHCEQLESYVVIDDISDHLPCVVVLKEIFRNKKSKIKITSRDTREKCINGLKDSLKESNWDEIVRDTVSN